MEEKFAVKVLNAKIPGQRGYQLYPRNKKFDMKYVVDCITKHYLTRHCPAGMHFGPIENRKAALVVARVGSLKFLWIELKNLICSI